jgi:hypothetical protein
VDTGGAAVVIWQWQDIRRKPESAARADWLATLGAMVASADAELWAWRCDWIGRKQTYNDLLNEGYHYDPMDWGRGVRVSIWFEDMLKDLGFTFASVRIACVDRETGKIVLEPVMW